MQAKLYPAKVFKDDKGKGTTHYMSEPMEYFVPSLQDIKEHLAKDSSFIVRDADDDKEAIEFTEATGLPLYEDETSNWLIKACNGLARGKATGAFRVVGDSPEEMKAEITGTLPTCMDDLLASERAGGAFFTQKAAYIAAFTPWIEKHHKRPKQFIAALARPSMSATSREAWPAIEKAVNAFNKTLENESAYSVYLRALHNQLNAEEEVEDWSDDLDF